MSIMEFQLDSQQDVSVSIYFGHQCPQPISGFRTKALQFASVVDSVSVHVVVEKGPDLPAFRQPVDDLPGIDSQRIDSIA